MGKKVPRPRRLGRSREQERPRTSANSPVLDSLKEEEENEEAEKLAEEKTEAEDGAAALHKSAGFR